MCMVNSTKNNSTVDHFEKHIESLNYNTQSKGSNSKGLAQNCKEISQLAIFCV